MMQFSKLGPSAGLMPSGQQPYKDDWQSLSETSSYQEMFQVKSSNEKSYEDWKSELPCENETNSDKVKMKMCASRKSIRILVQWIKYSKKMVLNSFLFRIQIYLDVNL